MPVLLRLRAGEWEPGAYLAVAVEGILCATPFEEEWTQVPCDQNTPHVDQQKPAPFAAVLVPWSHLNFTVQFARPWEIWLAKVSCWHTFLQLWWQWVGTFFFQVIILQMGPFSSLSLSSSSICWALLNCIEIRVLDKISLKVVDIFAPVVGEDGCCLQTLPIPPHPTFAQKKRTVETTAIVFRCHVWQQNHKKKPSCPASAMAAMMARKRLVAASHRKDA